MLISNPFASPLFPPTALLLAAFLGVTLLALLAIARFDLARLGDSVLFARWRVWAMIAPLYSLALFCGALTTLALVTFLVAQGLREYSRLVALPRGYEAVLLAAGVVVAPVAMLSLDAFHLLPALLLIVATLQPLVLRRDGGSVRAAVMNLGQADLMGDGIDYTVRAPGGEPGGARKCEERNRTRAPQQTQPAAHT